MNKSFLKKSNKLYLILIFFYFFIIQGAEIHAKNPIALLLGGFDKDCVVQRSNNLKFKAEPMTELFEGDKIYQKSGIQNLKIKLSPFTSIKKVNAKTIIILNNPPKDKKGFLKKLASFIGFEKERYKKRNLATRSENDIINAEDEPFFPQPGYWATLLPDSTITFAWDNNDTEEIVIKDNSDTIKFSTPTKGHKSIKTNVVELKLKTSGIYSWEVTKKDSIEKTDKYYLKILDKSQSDLIKKDLLSIGNKESNDTIKKLKRASYLQFISDTYPTEFDLYWKSYLILNEMDRKSLQDDNKKLFIILIMHYYNHLEQQMINHQLK